MANTLIQSVWQDTASPTYTGVQQPNNEDRILILEENQKAQIDSKGILGELADYLILFSLKNIFS